MPQTHIMVSFQGDEADKKALNALAADDGLTLGQAVRRAVDSYYGVRLLRKRKKFAARGNDMNQMETHVFEEVGDGASS